MCVLKLQHPEDDTHVSKHVRVRRNICVNKSFVRSLVKHNVNLQISRYTLYEDPFWNVRM